MPIEVWIGIVEVEMSDNVVIPAYAGDWRDWARRLREAAGDVLEVPEEKSFGSFADWADEFIRDNWQG